MKAPQQEYEPVECDTGKVPTANKESHEAPLPETTIYWGRVLWSSPPSHLDLFSRGSREWYVWDHLCRKLSYYNYQKSPVRTHPLHYDCLGLHNNRLLPVHCNAVRNFYWLGIFVCKSTPSDFVLVLLYTSGKIKGWYRDGLKHQKGRNKGSLHSKDAPSYMTPSLYLCLIVNFTCELYNYNTKI